MSASPTTSDPLTERDYPDAQRRGEWTLAAQGPEFAVTIGVHPILTQELQRRGDLPPKPVHGMALVDTGASQTLVHSAVIEKLGIPPMGVQRLRTFLAGDAVALSTHFVSLRIGDEKPWDGVVCAAPLAVQRPKTIALIGRDLLREASFHYDGAAGRITISLR